MSLARRIGSKIKRYTSGLLRSDPGSVYTNKILKGKYFSIGDFTYGNPRIFYYGDATKLSIGKFCSIADNVDIFLGGNHRTDWASTYPFNVLNEYFPNGKAVVGHPASKGDVIIGNDVWIGQGAKILSGVTIGNGAVIGAYAVVAKDVAPYEIVIGNPMRVVRKRFDDATIAKLQQLKWWDWEIEKINQNVPLLCSNHFHNLFTDPIG
jgi:acetyltransferase-like isoleucine patch superfamily enzyme